MARNGLANAVGRAVGTMASGRIRHSRLVRIWRAWIWMVAKPLAPCEQAFNDNVGEGAVD